MHLLVFSDIHQDWKALKRIVSKKADIYVCLGDFTQFGKGLEEGAGIMAPLREKLWLIPGNSETWEQTKNLWKKYGFFDFHQRAIKKGNYVFAGLGYSTPTPFNTPGEVGEEELEKALEKFEGLRNLCLFAHCPPKKTVLDVLPNGVHVGSQAIRDFIDNHQPVYFFSGHIHENEGRVERLGETTCFSVGKKGLEIWV